MLWFGFQFGFNEFSIKIIGPERYTGWDQVQVNVYTIQNCRSWRLFIIVCIKCVASGYYVHQNKMFRKGDNLSYL